jgi:O-antigen ligase
MDSSGLSRKRWFNDEEMMYSILCSGILITLVYWPLLNSIFCLAIFAYWLVVSKKTFSFNSLRGRLVVLFSLLYLLVIIGSFYSENMKEALFKLQQKPTYLIFPLVFGTTRVLTPGVVRNSIFSFVFATLTACLFCIGYGVYAYFFYKTTNYLTGYSMVTLKNMHPVIMGLCCILSVIFILENWYQERYKHMQTSYWKLLIAFFLIAFVFLVGNRSNLICLAGVLVFYAFRLMPKWKHRLMFFSLFILLFVVSFLINPFLRKQFVDLVDFSKEKTVQLDSRQTVTTKYGGKSLRVAIWRCAADIIEEHWLTGVGTGDVFAALENAYRRRQFTAAEGHREYNAHNQYMQETISYGIAGGLLLVALVVIPFMLPINPEVRTPYLLFLSVFAFVCLTECLLELNKGIIWYSFFNSFLIFRNDSFFTAENERTQS